MKKLISICLILSLLGCNEEAKINADIKDTTSVITPANNDQDPKPKIVDIDKWKISTKDAIKLEKYVDGCFLCDKDMNIINWNKGAYDAIQAQYPGSNIDTLKGRYKDDDDVIRYCGARGFYNGDLERCRVKKYKTLFTNFIDYLRFLRVFFIGILTYPKCPRRLPYPCLTKRLSRLADRCFLRETILWFLV